MHRWRRWFFDLPDRFASLDAKKDPLIEIDAVVPWEEFRPALERVWRRPMAAAQIFQTLALSPLCNLSDDQIQHQIRDRLSLMRFLELGIANRVQDAKTVLLYRDALAQAGQWRASPHYCCSDSVRGRGAAVKNLSHNASFQS